MMSIIGGLLVSIFVFFLFVLFVVGGLLRWVLRGLGFRILEPRRQSFYRENSQRQHSTAHQRGTSPSGKNKIFQRDNSEYVDFEEV